MVELKSARCSRRDADIDERAEISERDYAAFVAGRVL